MMPWVTQGRGCSQCEYNYRAIGERELGKCFGYDIYGYYDDCFHCVLVSLTGGEPGSVMLRHSRPKAVFLVQHITGIGRCILPRTMDRTYLLSTNTPEDHSE